MAEMLPKYNCEDMVIIPYFGKDIAAIVKNIYNNNSRVLYSLQVNNYTRLWVVENFIKGLL